MQVSIALAVRMRHHIDGHAVDGDIYIGAMVGVESPEKDLFCFTAPLMLRDEQPWDKTKQVLSRFRGLHIQVDAGEGAGGGQVVGEAGDNDFFEVDLGLLQFDGEVVVGSGFNSLRGIAGGGDCQGVDAFGAFEDKFSLFIGEGGCLCLRVANNGQFEGLAGELVNDFAGELMLGMGGYTEKQEYE